MTLDPILIGKRIRLTPMHAGDLPRLSEWFQDPATLRVFDSVPAFPKTEVALEEWVKASQKPQKDYLFALRLLDSEELIGYVEFDGIDWVHGRAYAAILIGDLEQRGKNYGFEAMQLALKFAFHELNLYRIALTIFEYNAASIKMAEKLGFVKEGVHRQFLSRDGKRFDMYLYGLLRPEWEAQQAKS